jgi:hypothetical protein
MSGAYSPRQGVGCVCGNGNGLETDFLQLIVESDFKELVDIVLWKCNISGATPILIRQIREGNNGLIF